MNKGLKALFEQAMNDEWTTNERQMNRIAAILTKKLVKAAIRSYTSVKASFVSFFGSIVIICGNIFAVETLVPEEIILHCIETP